VIEGVVVLSANQLPPMAGDEYIPVAKSEPIAFIGANTYVYRGRFEVPLVAAISRVHRSNHFLRVNDIDQAISEALQAVGLGPNDARPHLALGKKKRVVNSKKLRSSQRTIPGFATRKSERIRNLSV
jgi:hypothetical protein